MFYFCEHGKQAFSQIFFFKLMKEPAHSLFFFFFFFLKFFCSVGFRALSGLPSLHFGRDRRPLRLVPLKEEKASVLIFLPHT